MKIDQDTWEEWTAHPLTEALFKAFGSWASEAKQNWCEASWGGEQADPILLARMRERARAFEQLQDLSKDTLEEMT